MEYLCEACLNFYGGVEFVKIVCDNPPLCDGTACSSVLRPDIATHQTLFSITGKAEDCEKNFSPKN